MPDLDNILVLAVVIGAMALFVSEKLRVDLVALSVLGCLLVLRLIEPEEALYGFASPATATVAAMFVLSAGLVRTGLVEWLIRRIDRFAGKSQRSLILVLCVTIAALSAFIVNTATVAIFIPVAIALSRSRNIPPSRVLIPLSFASQFGGVCTLIGTSTNILVNTLAVTNGLRRFHLFEFAPLGLVMCAVGIVYFMVVADWLLPKRKGADEQVDKYRLSEYLAELKVKEGSPLIGMKWGTDQPKELKGIDLIKLIREEKATWRASATVIREGDLLLVHGDADRLMKMKNNYGLETRADVVINDKKMSSSDVNLVECLIPPQSRLVGETLDGSNFRRRFRCVVLALQRRGKVLRERLSGIELVSGDSLLLQCERKEVGRLLKTSDLIVTSEITELHLRKNRALTALGIVLLVVLLAAFNVLPILTAALLGAIGMVLFRCLNLEEAYQSIDWKVIFLLGGILPLGLALQQTGTAAWIADTFLGPLAGLGPIALLAVLYLITAAMTEGMSNNASAILLVPISLSIADGLGVDPRPFLVAITFAASTSFATPIGYQTNTMIYAPGGYKFIDFTRIGVPLNLIFWLLAILLIPVMWPF